MAHTHEPHGDGGFSAGVLVGLVLLILVVIVLLFFVGPQVFQVEPAPGSFLDRMGTLI